ncbi:CZB domain-containing protein [Candidatus Electronema sp. JC]|uniref:CZB domain-containing protein n=1 Tax=Candidatus Electronema sp. JC TaxID=3401570 RepID=UPI003AA8E8B0
MSIMITMDLQAAMIAHLNWKSKLADFFYGLEDLKADDVADHTACEFGRWLYSAGLQSLAGFEDLDTLEQLHKEVHQSIRGLVAMPQEKRNSPDGRQELAKFHEKCDRLVALLESMERQVKRKAA